MWKGGGMEQRWSRLPNVWAIEKWEEGPTGLWWNTTSGWVDEFRRATLYPPDKRLAHGAALDRAAQHEPCMLREVEAEVVYKVLREA
jgi:hypothetical protein